MRLLNCLNSQKYWLFENKEVVLIRGRFGPYIKFNNNFVSIKDFDINSITLDECIDLIEQKREHLINKNILVFLIMKTYN